MVQLQDEPETLGLLALMLLHESRRAARTTPSGDLILLEEQDRTLWNRDQIAEGLAMLQRAWSSRRGGPYAVQAAIASVHARAPIAAATDWNAMVGLYDLLLRIQPSPVVALNRAVAVAMRDGPQAGLRLIDEILEGGALADYHLAHAARADLYRRLGRTDLAKAAYEHALSLTHLTPERRFIKGRMRRLHR
jgi:RNA polymerase sigma-70 factor, ECF subfamily